MSSRSDKVHGHGRARREGGETKLDEESVARLGVLDGGHEAFRESAVTHDGWELYEAGDPVLGADELVARLVRKYGYTRVEVPAAQTPDVIVNDTRSETGELVKAGAVIEAKTPAAANTASRLGGEVVGRAGIEQPAPADEFTAVNFLANTGDNGIDPGYLAPVGAGAEGA